MHSPRDVADGGRLRRRGEALGGGLDGGATFAPALLPAPPAGKLVVSGEGAFAGSGAPRPQVLRNAE